MKSGDDTEIGFERSEAASGSLERGSLELAHLYRTAPVGLCLIDTDLRFIRVNEWLAAINGKPVDQHIGRTLREVIPELADQVESAYRQVIETGEPDIDREIHGTTLADPANQRVWLSSNHPLKSADGTLVGFSSVVQDITARKHAEHALRESKERMRRLVESTGVVPCESDVDRTRFRYVGPQAVKLLGQPLEHWYRKDFWVSHIHPDDRERTLRCFENCRTRRAASCECEYRMAAADGRVVWVRDIMSFEFPDRGPRSVRGFMIDITERMRIEEELARHRHHLEELIATRTAELERSHRKLRHAERLASIGTIAAGIAHQINNPVGGILLAAQYAATVRDDPAAIDGALEDIVADARRCGQIVRNLLRFAQEETTDKAPGDLNGLVRSCAINFSRGIEETGAELELGLDPDLPLVSLNEAAMGEVLSNLLQNSVEAGAKHIALRTRAGQASARLVVEDDGQGIAPEDVHHVFDPFFTTRQARGGTGLGLSIGHGIVADHGGTIEVESQPGHGTTVTIELPRAENEGGQDPHR